MNPALLQKGSNSFRTDSEIKDHEGCGFIYNNICTADGFSPEFIQLPRFKCQSAIIGEDPTKVQTILSEEFI